MAGYNIVKLLLDLSYGTEIDILNLKTTPIDPDEITPPEKKQYWWPWLCVLFTVLILGIIIWVVVALVNSSKKKNTENNTPNKYMSN
jgi:hypothetical protein